MNCLNCNNSTNNPKFCSRSCSASYNNKLFPKREKGIVYPCENHKSIKIKRDPVKCKTCEKSFIPTSGNKTYCSRHCYINHYYHYIEKNKTYTQPGCYLGCSKPIRKYLVSKHGNKCMICSQSGDNWNGNKLTLIVDHIDGDALNYHVDNIRIVCPNCDSQLPTYKGRNKGKSTRKYTIKQK